MLRAALSEANEEIARQADAAQRGQADLVNLRRRHEEERVNIREQANSRLLVHLLPIVDELDLAVNHLENTDGAPSQDGPNDSWAEGVRLIQRKLSAFLESAGVTRIESLGETFNPELHEAVGITQVSGVDSGCIVEVLRQGYRLHNRVVQVAQVVVNQ
jgi:molecular chaperone GrpE